MSEKYYITTPIYYPSGNWHIGHCYTTVICDVLSRYNKMLGNDVFFLTGTDEHGAKIQKKAEEKGITPLEFINPLVDELKQIWQLLDISYDKFIRTTDEEHVKSIQKIFKQLYDKGEIYKSEYEGWYCTPCESFWTETQLKDGKCPDCGREVVKAKEESYFFRLSKYAEKLIKLFEENPNFLQPKSRVNEMVNNFLKPGLQDLCVSRTTIKWGIPVDFDPKHTVYVWLDALCNYISALGYGSEDTTLFNKYWPANLHMVGKEIVRFHAIIWPALLMALDIPLPKQVYGHGWLVIGGDKLSKSKQDKISTELTDPKEIVERYGSDCLRYFLLREIPFGSDGVYSNESFFTRINADLVNSLGNLLSRTTAMISKYFNGVLPNPTKKEELDNDLINIAEGLFDKVKNAMDNLNAPEALNEIFRLVQRANKYIDETCPWVLAKDESNKERLGTVLYNLAESLRIVAVYLLPFITKAPNKILSCFKIENVTSFESVKKFGGLKAGISVEHIDHIFNRIDVQKECKEIADMVIARSKQNKTAKTENKGHVMEKKEIISYDDFAKMELRIGLIESCEPVKKSDKLYKLSVKFADETRTIVSGLQKYYKAEELIGKKVTVIVNLKPTKLMGIESQGMILCAEDENGTVCVLEPEKQVSEGSGIF